MKKRSSCTSVLAFFVPCVLLMFCYYYYHTTSTTTTTIHHAEDPHFHILYFGRCLQCFRKYLSEILLSRSIFLRYYDFHPGCEEFDTTLSSGHERNGRNGREWTFVAKKTHAFQRYVTLCHTMSHKRSNVKGFDR